ncbi:MAG TPA: hypothetical protein PLO52_00325 [Flavobacterium alvei]|nr:hypothetical protein [Flavobacterium alvei]
MAGLFWQESFTNHKGTESHAFTAGEALERFNFVKRDPADSFTVILATSIDEAIGYVLVKRGRIVQIGEVIEVMMGEWNKNSSGGSSGEYTPQGETTAQVGGIALGTDLGTTPVTVQSILDMMLYPDVGPQTNINTSPSDGLYEVGDVQSSVDLSSNISQGTAPLTLFTFSKSGSGIIFSDPSPSPGTETFTDTDGVSDDTTYTATVTDGTFTDTATATFTFVPVYYYGVDSPGLDLSSDGGGLTKVLQVETPSYSADFSPTVQVYYYAYPDAYQPLISILDDNGFETISDWTVTTGVNITNSFGEVISYRVYEFNNLTTQVNFTNTFIEVP